MPGIPTPVPGSAASARDPGGPHYRAGVPANRYRPVPAGAG